MSSALAVLLALASAPTPVCAPPPVGIFDGLFQALDARGVRPPTPRFGPLRIARIEPVRGFQGTIGESELRRVLGRRLGVLAQCFDDTRGPAEVSVVLRLVPQGRIQQVSFEALSSDAPLAACLRQALRRQRVPRWRGQPMQFRLVLSRSAEALEAPGDGAELRE